MDYNLNLILGHSSLPMLANKYGKNDYNGKFYLSPPIQLLI